LGVLLDFMRLPDAFSLKLFAGEKLLGSSTIDSGNLRKLWGCGVNILIVSSGVSMTPGIGEASTIIGGSVDLDLRGSIFGGL